MTQEEYITQNALGFEGDHLLEEKIKKIIHVNTVDCVIETGSYYGASTKKFAEMAPEVFTVEIIKENYQKTLENQLQLNDTLTPIGEGVRNIKKENGTEIILYNASSPDVLPKILENIKSRKRKPFIFLDAHWQDYCPILDELKIIAESKLQPIIAIHDFKVPDHPELGYDSYKGQDYKWSYIQEAIEKIYGHAYTIEYNSKAVGAKRGVIFIYPSK